MRVELAMLTVSGLLDFQVGGCRGELGRRGCTGGHRPAHVDRAAAVGQAHPAAGQDQGTRAATRKNRADPPINDRQQPKLLPNRDCSPRPKLPADRSWLFLFRALSFLLTLGFLLKHTNFSDPGQRAENVQNQSPSHHPEKAVNRGAPSALVSSHVSVAAQAQQPLAPQ
jgi:hypothetical protein